MEDHGNTGHRATRKDFITMLIKGMAALSVTFSLFAIANCAYAQEQTVAEFEGAWAAVHSRRGEQLEVSLEVVRDVGRISFRANNWNPVGSGFCEYVFSAEGLNDIDIFLHRNAMTPDWCPENLTMNFDRTGPNQANLLMNEDTFLENFDVFAQLRPFRPQDAMPEIEGLDILGLTLGASQTEIEVALTDMGFDALIEATRTVGAQDGSWTRESRSYNREGDTIIVSFSSVFAENPVIPTAVAISRDVIISAGEAITAQTIMQSLASKYGETSVYGDVRQYDRTGRLVTSRAQLNDLCPVGPLQEIEFQSNVAVSAVRLTCGPVVSFGVATDFSTGLATRFSVSMIHPDEVWDDFWQVWSASQYTRIRAIYDGITSATSEAPEL
ncbi:hypothetical protein [Roseicyclus mahoneyensis]|uniref:hypothetical protein n=1 Tax=Roseicyclus mahoneyensis TaxID=164332 RepID=UPI0011B20955|nr:hypothetical protein [Roseicyclus mahoneyensis]